MRRYARALVAFALAAGTVAGTAGWVSGDAQQALTGPPPGSAQWRADRTPGGGLPDPERATPGEVAQFFAGLSAAEQRRLVARHPSVVGNLDGAPLELRYRANALALAAEDDPRYRSLAAPGRRILAFDPRGRGQVAEVFGDLRTAHRVSVVVPGSDNDAGTFDRKVADHGARSEWPGPCRRRPARGRRSSPGSGTPPRWASASTRRPAASHRRGPTG